MTVKQVQMGAPELAVGLVTARFTQADADRAYEEWGSNCGPGAIAAVCGLTLDELRPWMGDFERKKYTNPLLMWQVLRTLGARFTVKRNTQDWPRYGLCRVQWEGPWTAPNVPMVARQRYSHWVGAATDRGGYVDVFDINAMAFGGWVPLDYWKGQLVPWLLNILHPRASGQWHLTHVVEVEAMK